MPEPGFLLLLFLASLLGGAQNAVAGGGTFLTFPSLIASGFDSKSANITSTVALWPGSVASIFGYKADLPRDRRLLLSFVAVSILGGILGAFVFLRTPTVTFDRLIPFLFALAVCIFAFGPALSRRLRLAHAHDGPIPNGKLAAFALVQFLVGFYGGYFGGGIGILMLAAFAALGMTNLNAMNGLKAVLGSLINGVAILVFGLLGTIDWPVALLMVAGSVVGGYSGAHLSRRVDPAILRRVVILIGTFVTTLLFLKAYA
ncbi:MAG TPA: sulfite exporter TauE/SafE family protein [Candidatus Thermoplasmatota archaeon]|nr:sulfite exporter TauE/SafE family protein [Candidatus Thermoplasmatota archaeon]